MKVKLFYRDGNNYKCTWIQEVDDDLWNDFVEYTQGDQIGIDHFLDKKYRSDDLFDIKEFGLTINDIPLVKQYGESYEDHPYVSIVAYGDLDE